MDRHVGRAPCAEAASHNTGKTETGQGFAANRAPGHWRDGNCNGGHHAARLTRELIKPVRCSAEDPFLIFGGEERNYLFHDRVFKEIRPYKTTRTESIVNAPQE